MDGMTLVEIGCGRGGGLNYLVNELKPEKTFGIDISEANIQFCKKSFDTSNRNVEFIVGDAQNLQNIKQLEDGMADFVVNIESAHCYADLDAFFAGVARILKQNGTFLFADFKSTDGMAQLQDQLTKHFEIVKQTDIKKNVVSAMTFNSDRQNKVIQNNYQWFVRYFMENMGGVKHSHMFNQISGDNMQYFAFQLRKREALRTDALHGATKAL